MGKDKPVKRQIISLVVSCGAAFLPGALASQAQTGEAVEWGEEVIPLVQPGIRFKAIAAGWHHSMALKPGEGVVVAWGDNSWG